MMHEGVPMKVFSAGSVLAVLVAALAHAGHSRAQTAGYQAVSNAAGYRFEVPSDWIPGTMPSPTEVIYGSALTAQGAYVVVKHPDVSSLDAALQVATADALSPSSTQVSYTVTSGATPVQIAGADAANSGSASYVTEDGISGNEYVIAAVRGTTGYLLIVDVTGDFDAASPSVAQTILGSFQLTSGGTVATPPPTGATPAPPAPSPRAAVVLTPQPLSIVIPVPAPTQTPRPPAPLNPPSSPLGSNAASLAIRTATPILPIAGGLAAATSPPPGCMSSSGGPCVTRCLDGTWSSNASGAGGCNAHGGEAH
jgi:hypothetical protein